MNEPLEEKSDCNVPTDSQHANCTQSLIRDLDDLSSEGKKKAMSQDQTEDVARKDTPTSTQTQSFEELLELLRELREKNIHGNFRPSPQYGAGSLGQPHTSTPDASRSSDATLQLLPERKIPSAYVTKVYHHYHYHYNTPNVPPPHIINKNIVRINNNNISNGSDSSESGDDEGEH